MKQNEKQTKNKSEIAGTVNINLIKAYMRGKQLTPLQFAEKCNLTLSELQLALDDFSDFDLEILLKIANTIKISAGSLINKK